MKRIVAFLAALVSLAALVWLVWPKTGGTQDEEIPVSTEVAVHLGTITRSTLHDYVTAYGTIQPQPPGQHSAASAKVAPSTAGVVRQVNCVEGQRVTAGSLLFQLDSRAADVAATKAQEIVTYAEKVYERQKKLVAVDGTSQKLFQESEEALQTARSDLAEAQTQQALLKVNAPLTGTVSHIFVKPGEAVDLNTTMAEMVDLARLVAGAGVSSAEMGSVKVGQSVEIVVDKSTPPLNGTLSYVGPEVDPKTGTAQVRATIPARSDLLPGQFITMRIVIREKRDCLAVPVESVVKNAEGVTVISVVRDGRAYQTPVKTGIQDGPLVEVEGDGVQAGARLVTEGAYGLPAETKIRVLGE
jgi:membrane fusion protein (multidrug efflux system)